MAHVDQTAEYTARSVGSADPGPRRRAVLASKDRRVHRGSPYRKKREAVWLLAPAVVVLVLVAGYPVFFLVRLSLSDWTDAVTGAEWVGLDHYEAHLGGETNFWQSVGVTLVFVIAAVLLEMVLGFGLALLIQEIRRARGIVRVLFLVPIVTTPVVAALTWKTLIFNPTAGMGTYALQLLGQGPVAWLEQPGLALGSVIFVEVWHWTPLVVLILLAGLVSLPQDLYEAARVDGASRWQTFRFVTLPLMVPVIMVALAFRTIDAFRTFDMMFALTGGGPGTSTLILPLFVYRTSFEFLHMGNGAAAAVLLIVLSASVVGTLLYIVGRFRAKI